MDVKKVLALVLGGGRGTRLFPLTRDRSKPAVPLAGKYRIIDVPLSNCINSGVQRIYVLTQFNSVSLHRHIRRTYTFDHFSGGFVEILAAQQTLDTSTWYQGTADAVRQHLRLLQQADVEHVLILSGDQLYRMNYADMLSTHVNTGADVTIAGIPVGREAASALGIMRLNESGRVEGFLEKPKTNQEADLVKTDPAWIDRQGVPSNGRDLVASMGIYLFNRECLVDLLMKTDYQDFGKEVFPAAIRAKNVQLHLFDDYWEHSWQERYLNFVEIRGTRIYADEIIGPDGDPDNPDAPWHPRLSNADLVDKFLGAMDLRFTAAGRQALIDFCASHTSGSDPNWGERRRLPLLIMIAPEMHVSSPRESVT